MQTDVLVVGGSAAGIVAATTAKSHYQDKKVTMLRKEEKVLVPCGIPYIFGTLGESNKNIIPDAVVTDKGVDIVLNEAISVDFEKKECICKDGEVITYEKIIFATGSVPRVPTWLKGADLEGVYTVAKDKAYLDNFYENIKNVDDIVVIGGGFIGVEISDELKKQGKNVTIIEVLPYVLGAVFDENVANKAEEVLKSRGVSLKCGSGIKSINGDTKVKSVTLENGDEIKADAVILAMGYTPNNTLALSCGLELNKFSQINVDEYMRTSVKDVFATGDCASKRDFITGKTISTMLASIACYEGKVAGSNLYGVNKLKNAMGIVSMFSTAIGDDVFASVGYTKMSADNEGLDSVHVEFTNIDKHPANLPNAKPLSVELVVMKNSGAIIGGTISGGVSVGELVNALGIAIQTKTTVQSLSMMQVATHPLLTSSPVAHPLIKAAEMAYLKLG